MLKLKKQMIKKIKICIFPFSAGILLQTSQVSINKTFSEPPTS